LYRHARFPFDVFFDICSLLCSIVSLGILPLNHGVVRHTGQFSDVHAADLKLLRVVMSSFLDMLLVSVKTLLEFGDDDGMIR
jgi:hypothetical protein